MITIKWGEATHFRGRNDPGRIDPGRTGNRGETTQIHKYRILINPVLVVGCWLPLTPVLRFDYLCLRCPVRLWFQLCIPGVDLRKTNYWPFARLWASKIIEQLAGPFKIPLAREILRGPIW